MNLINASGTYASNSYLSNTATSQSSVSQQNDISSNISADNQGGTVSFQGAARVTFSPEALFLSAENDYQVANLLNLPSQPGTAPAQFGNSSAKQQLVNENYLQGSHLSLVG